MILVTGGSGLVGTALIAQLLAEGKPVRALYNKTPIADFHSHELEQVSCNILDVVRMILSVVPIFFFM